MDQLLAWQNVIFYIPLLFGLLMVIAAAMGIGGETDHDIDHDFDCDHDVELDAHADVDHDVDHDLDHDHDHDHDSGKHVHSGTNLMFKVFSLLGVGKVPLSIILMIVGLVFGGSGMVANQILAPILIAPAAYGWISVIVACTATVLITGPLAHLINRIMPSTESYNVTKEDLCGQTGTLTLPASSSSGLAIVRDHEGNVHNIRCRTVEGTLPKNANILVVDFDTDNGLYRIVEDPSSGLLNNG